MSMKRNQKDCVLQVLHHLKDGNGGEYSRCPLHIYNIYTYMKKAQWNPLKTVKKEGG
jgi:hypothetical protein